MRQITPCLLVLAVTGCFPTQQRVEPEASERRYALGADYFEKRMYRPALEELMKSIELNPDNAEAHNLLGLLHLQEASDSESMIERVSCVGGDEAKLERLEVDARFKKAETEFRKAVTIKPDFSEAWNSIAVVEIYFRRWDEAITAGERALSNALYRSPWAAQGNLGWALFQKREMLRASKELRTALFANPSFCVGRYRLAKVYFEQQNLEEAAEELGKVTSDQACPIQEAFLLAGMTSIRRGDRTIAREMFRRCEALAPKSCVAKQCRIAE